MVSIQIRSTGRFVPPIPTLADVLRAAQRNTMPTSSGNPAASTAHIRTPGTAVAGRAETLIREAGTRQLTRRQIEREFGWTEAEAKSALTYLRRRAALKVVARGRCGCIYRIG